MFNMFLFQNKVCVSHPKCLLTSKWKQTHKRWDSSHPWVLLLPFWHSLQSPSVAPPSKLFIPHRPLKLCFQRGELLVRRSLLVTQSWSQQRCSLWHRCVPQLAALQGWRGFIWALVTLHQEGHRAAGVPSLFCLRLVPQTSSQTGLSLPPPGEKQLFFLRKLFHDVSLDSPSDSLWHKHFPF